MKGNKKRAKPRSKRKTKGNSKRMAAVAVRFSVEEEDFFRAGDSLALAVPKLDPALEYEQIEISPASWWRRLLARLPWRGGEWASA